MFLLVGISAYSQKPSPTPTILSQPQQNKTTPKQTKSNYIEQYSNKLPLTGKTIGTNEPQPKEGNQTKKTNEEAPVKWDIWLLIFFNGLLAIFTLGLYISTCKLWQTTKKVAEATKVAADAAKKSVDTIPTVERAYVYISSVSADFESWRNTKPNQCSPINITVRNYGRTPAKLTGIITKFHIGKSDGIRISWGTPDDDEIIDAVGRFIASNSENEFFYYIHDTIGDGRYNIIFSGEVKYRDIFEKEV